MYNSVFLSDERERIESYLAIKYGITLDQTSATDYLASDGAPIWNATDNNLYDSDIAGIGRDDASGLSQLKSKSINDDAVITIALSNVDAPSAFTADDSWLVWGHDGSDSDFGTDNIANNSSGNSDRMNRVWRVDETGTVGAVEIALDDPTGLETLSLVVHSSNPTFPVGSGRDIYQMQHDGTQYRVTVDFSDGDYFSFAEGDVDDLPGVLITEVVTSPQQDWSTDEFHNPSPAAGTVDENDEWVELFVTEDNLNLSGWTIELNDGSDISGSLLAGGAFTYSNYNSLTGGLFLATDSGDYFILGNVNGGDMEDVVNVILRDANGDIVDQVDIGTPEKRKTDFTGASSGISDESVSRFNEVVDTNSDSTDFVLTQATLSSAKVSIGTVLINEIVTDPQTDWGENDFDGSDGATDTTAVDEWIELYIATDDLNLTNWVLDIENGANDITQENLEAGGAFVISNYFSQTGGTFTKTDSGDYLVLGNAANSISLRNDIEISLYDPLGSVIDQVTLGGGTGEAPSGDADGFEDEAVARYPNATDTDTDDVDFIQTRPTLGSTNSPTGTVVINEVVTDPQQQWDTNGFDGTIGDDGSAISGSDEWIELFIADDSINLTGWTLTIEDSNVDVDNGLITSSGPFGHAVYFSDAEGSFTRTAAGDYYVLGDASGNMTDDVLITLRDATGAVVDEVEIGDDRAGDGNGDGAPDGGSGGGNASGLSDEAVARIPNAIDTDDDVDDFTATIATLGRANSTAPVAQIGNALTFDKTVDQYVQIPDAASFDIETTFSVESWIYLDSYNTNNSIIFDKWVSGVEEKVLYINSSGNLIFSLFYNPSSHTVTSTAVIPLSIWTHVAATFDNGTTRLYIDGIEVVSGTNAGNPADGSGDVFIGGSGPRPNGDDLIHDGLIDEVRIWSDVRTQEDLLEYINSTIDPSSAGLIAYYRFDQSTGTSLPDLTGANDGTLTNMADDDWITADWPVYAENSTIVQSSSVDVTPATSGQLSISDASFLIDDNDILLVGHESSDFDTVATELPANTLVTNRYARSWHLTKNDASGTAGGNVTMSFEIGTEPDSSLTYYLLESSDPSTDFEITPIVGYQPGATSVDFTIDVDSLTDEQYYTLGWSDVGPGNALDFDGTGDDVNIPDATSLNPTTEVTVEAWIKPTLDGTWQLIATKWNDTGSMNDRYLYHLAIEPPDDKLSIYMSENGQSLVQYAIDDNSMTNDEWAHVAFTANATSGDVKLYINGIQVGTTGSYGTSTFPTISQPVTIGGKANGVLKFDGQIDDVRIWSTERSQQEIIGNMHSPLTGTETGLVGYYRMNQGIGNDAYTLPDLSGNGNVGQLQDFDNLANATASSNWVTADRYIFEDNVVIINTDTDILTNSSDELTLTSTTSDFLQDEGDFIRWGHDGGDFSEVATDLPANSNLAARIARTWNIGKGDVSTNDGLVTFAFNLDTSPDPDYTYYLLQRSGSSGDFSITEVLGAYPDNDSVKFTVDGSQITSGNYYTLGRSDAGPGHTLDFDGTDDEIDLSTHVASFDIDAPATVEFWYTPPSGFDRSTDAVGIFSIGDNGTEELLIAYGSTAAGLTDEVISIFHLDGTATRAGYSNGSLDNNIHHWAIVASGTEYLIYLDGEQVSVTYLDPTDGDFGENITATEVKIGNRASNGDLFTEGVIDEFRLWSDARTNQEIQDNLYRSLDVANESNLIAYYKFDDGIASGTNTNVDSLVDYSGNDHVGVLTNLSLSGTASNWVASDAVVAESASARSLIGAGNALDFDGNNDEVDLGDNLLDGLSTFSLEAWFYPTAYASSGNIGSIISKGDIESGAANGNFGIYFKNDGSGDSLVVALSNGTVVADTTLSVIDNNIVLNEWHHVAVTWTAGDAFILYLNGVRIEPSETLSASLANLADDLLLGNSTSANEEHFQGLVDEIRLWSDVRTEVEIQSSRYVQLNGDEADLLAYYKFDEYADASNTTLEDITSGNVDGTLNNMTPASDWVSASGREAYKPVTTGGLWSSATNWKSGTAPDANDLPVFVFTDITVDSDFSAGSLIVLPGVTLTMNGGNTLSLNRNLFNYGTISGEGTVVMTGDDYTLSGGTISNIRLEGDSTRMTNHLIISGTLDLDPAGNSILYTDEYNLTIDEITNFGPLSYIANKNQNSSGGYVIKSLEVADGDFTFPLASNGSYTPLTVTNLGSTGNIQARVFDDTYAQGTSGVIIATEKEVNKSWEINGDAGVNVTVTLHWNSGDEDPNYASARSTAYMSKNDYNWWEKITPDIGTTGSDPYEITASGIQTFSVFGTGTEDSSLPVTWMAFEAFENEDQEVELYWSTASELNNDRFEIEKSFDGRTFHVIGQMVGNGTTNSLSDYQFIDTEPFNGINYYRLRQVDYDGTDDYSELVSVFVDVQREYNITLSPNPTFDVTTLSIEWENDDDYAVGIFDMMGRNLGVVHSKFSKLNLDLSALPKGMYVIKIHTGDRVVARKLIKH